MDIEEVEVNWRKKAALNRDQQETFNRLLLGFTIIGAFVWIGFKILSDTASYETNLFTGFLDIGITIIIIEYLNRRRARQELKKQLIRELSSTDNGLALRALRELRDEKWVRDGSLQNCYLQSSNLRRATLNGADLRGSWCPSANFEEADMWNINLQDAYIGGANFCKATLSCSDLAGLNAGFQTIFQKANLVEVNLSRANLYDADFTNADLNTSNLCDCNLIGANLSGANLTMSNLQGANLEGAIFDETTRLPNGKPYSPIIDENLELFTNPGHENFWRPEDETEVWWTGKGRPQQRVEAVTMYKTW